MRGIIEMEAKIKASGCPHHAFGMRLESHGLFGCAARGAHGGHRGLNYRQTPRDLLVRNVFNCGSTLRGGLRSPTA